MSRAAIYTVDLSDGTNYVVSNLTVIVCLLLKDRRLFYNGLSKAAAPIFLVLTSIFHALSFINLKRGKKRKSSMVKRPPKMGKLEK